MSLTRDEWCQLWEAIKKIERVDDFFQQEMVYHEWAFADIKCPVKEIKLIKQKIQQVIGQME